MSFGVVGQAVGASFAVQGYRHLTVLDISAVALEWAKNRLGKWAGQIVWLVSDVTTFYTVRAFDVWHGRATFHFLTEPKQVDSYLDVAGRRLHEGGFLAVGTFSEQGPSRCSSLPVWQYSPETLSARFARGFRNLGCQEAEHTTPTGAVQCFIFCQFQRQR